MNLEKEIDNLETELLEKSNRLAELKRKSEKVKVPDYEFKSWSGTTVRLSTLFKGKEDLIVIHNMGKSCPYCTLWADGFNGVWQHLENRAGFVVISPDSPENQKEFAQSRGWQFEMLSGEDSSFIEDMGFKKEDGWWPGVSTFRKEANGEIYRVAQAIFGPMDLFCGTWHLMSLLADGINDWEPKYSY